MFVRESHFFVAEPPLLKKVEAHRRETNWVWSWATRTGEKKRSPKHACSFRSSSRKVMSQPLHRFVSLLTLQEHSQTGQNFGGWIQNKKPYADLEFAYWQLNALCSFNFLFFRVLLLPQQNEIQLVSRFFLSSKPFGPGNLIQSLAMPISVMNVQGEGGISYKSDGDARFGV